MARSTPEGPIPVGRDADAAWIDMRVAARLFGAIPRQIGRYTILETLGSGGMGLVYRAHDPQLDRVVAIKLLNADWSTPDGGRRLHREARAMARLSHPNVVQVYEVGQFDERVFLAMELVEGETLEAWLKRGPSYAAILDLFLRIGEGVDAAHRVGLTHRDLKPSNILVDARGTPKVADFGLARTSSLFSGEHEPTLPDCRALGTLSTEDGVFVGTLRYMAPEQHHGRTADARSDQFTYCLMLWEALCGARPIPEPKSVGGLRDEDWIPRPPPRGVRLPARLRKALARGLDLDPERRWPTMAALLAELARPGWAHRYWRSLALLSGLALVGTSAYMGRTLAPPPELVAPPPPPPCDPERHEFLRYTRSQANEWRAALDRTPSLQPVHSDLEAMIDDWYGETVALCELARSPSPQVVRRALHRSACLWSGADVIGSWLTELDLFLSQPRERASAPAPRLFGGLPLPPPPEPLKWNAAATLWRFCPVVDDDGWSTWRQVLSAQRKQPLQVAAQIMALLRLRRPVEAEALARDFQPASAITPASYLLLKADMMRLSAAPPQQIASALEAAEDAAEFQRDDGSLVDARLAHALLVDDEKQGSRLLAQAATILDRMDVHQTEREAHLKASRARFAARHEGPVKATIEHFPGAVEAVARLEAKEPLVWLLIDYADQVEAMTDFEVVPRIEAIDLLREALKLSPRADDVRGHLNYRVATTLLERREWARAAPHLDAAIDAFARVYARDHVMIANLAYQAGVDFFYAGESAAGLKYANRAIEGYRAAKEPLALASSLYLRSASNVRLGEGADAVADAGEALAALAAASDVEKPEVWRTILQTALVEAQVAAGETDAAIALAREVLRTLARRPALNENGQRDELELALAKALHRQGRLHDAARALGRVGRSDFLGEDCIKRGEALVLRAELPGLSAAAAQKLRAAARSSFSECGHDGISEIQRRKL